MATHQAWSGSGRLRCLTQILQRSREGDRLFIDNRTRKELIKRALQEKLLEILACPECKAAVKLADGAQAEGQHIHSGTLVCSGCGNTYPIKGGIPRLIPKQLRQSESEDTKQRETASHFTQEFTALSEDDQDMGPPEIQEYYFYSRTGLDPLLYERLPGNPYRTSLPAGAYRPDDSFLKGKRVLDAGCGPARLTTVAATSAEHVVGLDLGNHIERAYARCRHLPNTDFVQGSVLDPPFLPNTFDYIFSLGVLHHTPDPRRGCLELSKLLKPEGAISVWVYPPDYWGSKISSPFRRRVHRIVSRLPPEKSFEFCVRWLYPLGRVQMTLARHRLIKLLTAPLFLVGVPRHPQKGVMIATIHDYYGPPIISTHTYEEVRGWLEEAGLERLTKVPVPTAWFAQGRRQPEKPPAS